MNPWNAANEIILALLTIVTLLRLFAKELLRLITECRRPPDDSEPRS